MPPVNLYFSDLAKPTSLRSSSDLILGLVALVVVSVVVKPAFLSEVELRNRHEQTLLLLPWFACRTDLLAKLLHLVLVRKITCLKYDGDLNKRDTRAMER